MDDFEFMQMMMDIFNDVRAGKSPEPERKPVPRSEWIYALMHDRAISADTFHRAMLDIIENQ